ncbi:MAG: hypothetical protein ACLPV8_27245 [Steroidobacteraceae bacterium]
MPGLLNMSSMMMCPHGGQVQPITSNTRVQAAGDYVLRASDTFLIAGCPFIIALAPHPCMQVQWVQPAEQSQVMSDFTLTEASVGLCTAADQSVQGPVSIVLTQPRVAGQ